MAQNGDVFGSVGRTTVTINEVQQRLMQTGGPRAGETLEAAFERVADELIAELVVERQLSRLPRFDPRLNEQLARMRRELMMEFFLQTNVESRIPTEAEIQAFVAENPQFFEDRASFWITQFLLEFPDEDARSNFDAALDTLRAGELTPVRILDLQRRLLEIEVPFQRQSIWRSSEQLPPELLDRLEALYASDERIELIVSDNRAELLLLLQRTADPVDPELQRQQIVQGFFQQSIMEQRNALIASLAQPVRRGDADADADAALEASDGVISIAGAEDPDDLINGAGQDSDVMAAETVADASGAGGGAAGTAAQRWMFAIPGGLGLLFPLALWSGRQIPKTMHPGSRRVKPARIAVTLAILAGMFASLWVASRMLPLLGTQTVIALGSGGLVMGALAALAWGRRDTDTPPETARASKRFGWAIVAQVTLLAAYLVA